MSNPHFVDAHVGNRLRVRRNMLDMSQGGLGEKIGLTFQQVQKYESGANRISASRLYEISRVLDVPIDFFFENVDSKDSTEYKIEDAPYFLNEQSEGYGEETDPLKRRDSMELLSAFYSIQDETVRKKIFELIMALQGSARGRPRKKEEPEITG